MKPLIAVSLFFALSVQDALSQSALKGVVTNEESRPLASVSVYLNNTSTGTITNDSGRFVLRGSFPGKVTLVCSYTGYETEVRQIDQREFSKEIRITLKQKSEELQGISVSPPDPDGWKKWGAIFTEIFIGNVPTRSNNCKLMNPEVIKFRMNKNNELIAYSREPLIIMNYALGYEIRYKLEDFEYDFNTKLTNYSGYALFSDMGKNHPKAVRRYAQERLETYRGSLLHFMRSFYRNDLEVQGFEMHSLGLISNPEKDRAKLIFSQHKDSIILVTTGLQITTLNNGVNNPYIGASTESKIDSTDYFRKKLMEPDSVISHQLVTGDSIGFAVDSTIAAMYFPDSLEVSFKLKEIPNRYRSLSKEHKNETYPVSQFVFRAGGPVYVFSNGYYYKLYDLKITGYWAWSECMSTRLPYDYSP